MGLVSLLRKERALAGPPPSPTAPPPAGAHDARREEQIDPIIRQLESDVTLAMRVISRTTEHARAGIEESVALAERIRGASENLSTLSTAATEISTGLAHTAEGLNLATQAIQRNVADADAFVREAKVSASEAIASMARVATAVDRIAGIVQVISAVARQTNLLALHATIEAARAGPSGRSFALVASEVKSLATQVQKATTEISAQIAMLQAVARQNAQAVAKIAGLIDRLDPALRFISDAVLSQTAETQKLSVRAAENATFIEVVAQKASEVKCLTADAIRTCRDAGASGAEMPGALSRLSQRSTVFLRAHLGNRRRFERLPVKIPGLLDIDRRSIPVTVLDLSKGGVLLSAVKEEVRPESGGRLKLEGIGTVPVTVVAISDLGMHIRFDRVETNVAASIDALIARILEENRPLIEATKISAAEISRLFEEGIARGEVRKDDLITIDYRPVPDTDPIQYETGALAFYQKVLPPIIEHHWRRSPTPIFVLATDRNSYIPVHSRQYSKPQRHNDPVWNDLNARNKRIMERWQTLVISRNREPCMLKVFMREMNDKKMLPIKVAASPILVQGDLWGNFQLGYTY